MWKMFLAECFFSWFTRTKYLLQYTKPSNCSGLVFIRLKWWRLSYTFYIQQLWYLPFCSSGWIGKHGPLSIFIGGHQSTTATGVGVIIIDNFSSHSSTSIFSSLFCTLSLESRSPLVQVLMLELCHANLTSWALVRKWQYRVLCFCIDFFNKAASLQFLLGSIFSIVTQCANMMYL